MALLFALIIVAGYGVWYAKDPVPYLQRRMKRQDIPEKSIKTARVVGIIMAVLGAAGAVYRAVSIGLIG